MTGAIDICILFDMIDSPWGGGNQFLKSLSSELSAMGNRVSSRPTPDTQVVLLDAHNMGANKFLSARNERQTGKMTLLGRFLPKWYHMRGERKSPVLIHRVDGIPEVARGHRTSKVLKDIDRFLIRHVSEEYLPAFRYASDDHERC